MNKRVLRVISLLLAVLLSLTCLPMDAGEARAAGTRQDIITEEAELRFDEDEQGNLLSVSVVIRSTYNTLTVPELLPVAENPADGVKIHIDIPDDFTMTLVIPTQGDNANVVLMEQQADGSYKALSQMLTLEDGIVALVLKDSTVVLSNNAQSFPDIPQGFWAEEEIDYVSSLGIMQGKLNGNFDPGETITRKTVAMILYRMMGEPAVSGSLSFPDVKQDRYYNAILWANQAGIVTGYNDGTFRPDGQLTRQHFAVMLHRFTQFVGFEMVAQNNKRLTDFVDYNSIYSWARNSAHWASATGIINGRANGGFDPQGNTTRAQLAVIMARYTFKFNQYAFMGSYESEPVYGEPGQGLDFTKISVLPGYGKGDDSLSSDQKLEAARVVAQEIADEIMSDPNLKTDLDRIAKASAYAMKYGMAAINGNYHPDYKTAYGLFISGIITCAGNVRGLKLILECMGFECKHINENQWTHQWLEVYDVDGMTAFADGSFYYGVVGYGKRETDPWYYYSVDGTSPYGFMER